MSTSETQTKLLNSHLDRLKKILVNQSEHNSIRNPETAVPKNHFDEVFENCFLGDAEIAFDKAQLKILGITHILNAAKGEKFSQVNTNQAFYNDLNIKFYGCSLMDVENSKIENHFNDATNFINQALDIDKGKILVHCFMGISRSASFIVAYLIRYRQVNLEDSLKLMVKKRLIWPNDGFLKKLIKFEDDHLKIN